MKKTKNNEFSPYATYNGEKIDAPKALKKAEPRASKIAGTEDLRGGRRK